METKIKYWDLSNYIEIREREDFKIYLTTEGKYLITKENKAVEIFMTLGDANKFVCYSSSRLADEKFKKLFRRPPDENDIK